MEVVVTVKAVVRVAALNRSNLSNCMFGGGIGHICSSVGGGSGSGSGVNSGCGGSSIYHHHYQYHQHNHNH